MIIAYDDAKVKGNIITANLENSSLEENLIPYPPTDVINLSNYSRESDYYQTEEGQTRGLSENNSNSIQQDLFIHGKVYDESTGAPLQYASVYFIKRQSGVNTDINGYFKLPLPYLLDTLEISYLGFEKKSFPLSALTPGELVKIHLAIKIIL